MITSLWVAIALLTIDRVLLNAKINRIRKQVFELTFRLNISAWKAKDDERGTQVKPLC